MLRGDVENGMEWLTTAEVAEYLRTPVKTVRHWHYSRLGPPSYKIGRRVMYLRPEIDEWLASVRQPAGPSAGLPSRRPEGPP